MVFAHAYFRSNKRVAAAQITEKQVFLILFVSKITGCFLFWTQIPLIALSVRVVVMRCRPHAPFLFGDKVIADAIIFKDFNNFSRRMLTNVDQLS